MQLYQMHYTERKILRSELEHRQGSDDHMDLDSVSNSKPKFTSLTQMGEKQDLKLFYLTKELEISQEVFYPQNGQAVACCYKAPY